MSNRSAGGGSVLLRKERSYAEVYNDLDDEVVGLFRVARDPSDSQRLIEALRLTPFARTEFEDAYLETDDPIERCRRLIIRSFMGFGSDGVNSAWRTGFRANSNRSGTTPAHDWMNYPDCLQLIVERLQGVIIENRDARAVIAAHDAPDTLIYADPPYVHSTRSQKARRSGAGGPVAYRHEMTDGDHIGLLKVLAGVRGMVVLSGYPSALYDAALTGWHVVKTRALADGARAREEVLWLNPRCVARLRDKGPLFEMGAA